MLCRLVGGVERRVKNWVLGDSNERLAFSLYLRACWLGVS